MAKIKTYKELSRLPTFEERFEYLKQGATVGEDTFGRERYLNQKFYTSPEWRRLRKFIIARDLGCDLGVPGREITNGNSIYIHHMNPISVMDILGRTEYLTNPEYLICTTKDTHRAIHYGTAEALPHDPVERKPGDTCPWRSAEKGAPS